MEDTNHTTHTKRRVIIFIVLLAAFLLIGLMADKKDVAVDTPTTLKQCYIWNTEAGDKATIVFEANGADIAGNIAFIPAEKDKKTGGFTGTLSVVTPDTGVIQGWWNTSAEGMTAKEQVIITVSGSTAAIGFGEMKQEADGSYVYANPAALSYEPTLQQTDCSDPAL